jgi:predicted nucleotidyltransferase component of viral defense system
MAISEVYRRQVGLLVRTLPLVSAEKCFALKGGTAINLFVRDMPRLSVDIDLTYVPVAGRKSSLEEIDAAMRRIAAMIEKGIRGAHVSEGGLQHENCATKLLVRADGVQVKIEVTPVLRGCVYDPAVRSVCTRVEEQFGFAEIQVVSFSDLYAGKIVAALDRQHPRDLFDVRDLLANEGISDELRKAFLVYLVSHHRPMAEVLAPSRRDLREEFGRGFDGMTGAPVTLGELLEAREKLISAVVANMPADHRHFLLSIKRGVPDWRSLDLPGAELLPAVQWKMENLASLDETKREGLLGRLGEVLRS